MADLFKSSVILLFWWEQKGAVMDGLRVLSPSWNPGARNYSAFPKPSWGHEQNRRQLAGQGPMAPCLSPFAMGFASAGTLVTISMSD